MRVNMWRDWCKGPLATGAGPVGGRCRLAVFCALWLGLVSLPLLSDDAQPKPQAGKKETPAKAESDAGADVADGKDVQGDDRNTKDERKAKDEPNKELFSGRVVWLSDALKRKKIKSYPEELKGQIVLESKTGELWPIVPDWRGRAFYQDERLRDRPVDLIVNHRAGVPYLQVLSIFTFDDQGARQLTDYWCDICAIPMYEIKDCECCQGPTRLRFQPKELPSEYLKPGKTP